MVKDLFISVPFIYFQNIVLSDLCDKLSATHYIIILYNIIQLSNVTYTKMGLIMNEEKKGKSKEKKIPIRVFI